MLGHRGAPSPAPRRGSDRGSTTTTGAALLAVAIVAAVIGYGAQKATHRGSAGDLAATTASASAGAAAALTADEVAARLVDVGLPLQAEASYTAENDPNQVLGKPGAYTSKVTFVDTRTGVDQLGLASKDPIDQGGSIEVFADHASAASRLAQLRDLSSADPLLQEYDYQQGLIILRVSRYLAQDDISAYEKALATLAVPAADA